MPYYAKRIDGNGAPHFDFKCFLCWHILHNTPAIMKHLMKHKYWVCQLCDNKKFRQSTKLHNHIMQYHGLEIMTRKFKCPDCVESFTDIRSYTKHTPCNFKLSCGFCNFKTKSEDKLKWHVESNHCIETVRCWDCSLYFVKYDDLKKHILEINDINFVCPSCGIIFHTKEFLDAHLQIYGTDHNCDMIQDIQTDDEDGFVKKESRGNLLDTSSCDSTQAVLQER